MNVAISSTRTKNVKIDRGELITELQKLGHRVFYIGKASNHIIHPDYEKYNVEFLSIPIERSNTNPFKEIKAIIKAKSVLREAKIETLIAYGIRTFPTMVISAKLAGVRNILCIVNGSGRLFQLKGVKGLIIKFFSYPMLSLAFLLSNCVLFQNPDDLKMIKRKRLLFKENYGVVNGSGVNLEKFSYKELPKEPVFLMISRITGSKGINEYVQAAICVKKKYPNSKFLLIGPMDEDDSSVNMDLLQKAIKENVILYLGRVEDVRPYIHQCRFFVLPSYYPEGIPRAILEAMAVGRPIITTDSAGCRETVVDGFNGFLVPIRNVEALVEKMVWMIEHKKEVNIMGENSRKFCEQKFDVKKVNEFMLKKINLI